MDRTGPGWLHLLSRIFGPQEIGLVGIILVLGLSLAAFGGNREIRDRATGEVVAVQNRFANWDNLVNLAKDTSFIAIMAIGVTFVIVTGGIDLSVGSTYCLAAVCGAMFLGHRRPFEWTDGAPPILVVPAGILLCLAVGLLGGLLNGSMVVLLRVHPFIITLGTMGVFRGIAFVTTRAQSITGFPPEFTDGLIRYKVLGIHPVPMAVMLAAGAAAAVYLALTVAGRHVYAVGGNEEAARFSGLPVDRVKLGVYALAGLSAGIAAVLALGYYGAADSSTGKGYELDVIAAAVVGGGSLSGGRGTAFGALLGALIIQMISNGIIILQIDQNYSQIIIGTVIVLAVVLDRINAAFRQRRLASARRTEARRPEAGSDAVKGVEG